MNTTARVDAEHAPSGGRLSPTVVAAQLTAPQLRAGLIDRRRTAEGLAGWSSHRISLIVAPAGYGKSTFAAQLAAQAPFAVSWLTVSVDDDDPAQVLQLLTYAIARIAPLDRELVVSRVLDIRDEAAVHRALQTALQAVAVPIGIVLDDLQHLTNSAALQQLERVVLRSPPHVHWLLLARRQPGLALSRLRLSGELFEWNERELSFAAAEVQLFLTQRTGRPPLPQLVDVLMQRSHGWIAGVKLAALRLPESAWSDMTQLPYIEQMLHAPMPQISDYLFESVLQNLPADLFDFLLRIAPLPRFTAELCAVVSGREDSRTLLHRLLEQRLFIEQFGPSGDWYVLHALLRSTLLELAPARISADERAAAALRAADWYSRHDGVLDAAQLLLQNGRLQAAADMIDIHSKPLLMDGRLYELQRLVALLPDDLIRRDGRLLHVVAWTMFHLGDFDSFQRRLRQLHLLIAETGVVPTFCVTVLDLLADYTSMQHADVCVRAVAALHQDQLLDSFSRAWLLLLAAMSFRPTVGRSAVAFAEAARGEFQRADAPYGESMAISIQIALQLQALRLKECIAMVPPALLRADRLALRAVSLDLQATLLRALCDALYLGNERTAAHAAALQLSAVAAQLQSPLLVQESALRLQLTADQPQPADDARCAAAVGSWLASPEARTMPGAVLLSLVFALVRVAARSDALLDLAEPVRCVQPDLAVPDLDAPDLLWQSMIFVLVLSDRFTDDDLRLLDHKISWAEANGALQLQLWLLTLASLQAHRRRDHERARKLMRRSLNLVERSGAQRIVLDIPGVRPILQAVDTRMSRNLLRQIPTPPQHNGGFTLWESRVAACLRLGLSATQTAAELCVSVSTVRYHLTSIYRKLAVSGRAEAIARLRVEGDDV